MLGRLATCPVGSLEVELLWPKKLLHNLLTFQHSCKFAADWSLELWLAATLPVVYVTRERAGCIRDVIAPSCQKTPVTQDSCWWFEIQVAGFLGFALAEQDLFQRAREKNLKWGSFQDARAFCPGGDFVARRFLLKCTDSGRRESCYPCNHSRRAQSLFPVV